MISHNTFGHCANLRKVEFAEGTESLGKEDENSDDWWRLFSFCGVEEVVLPSTLREISPNIFKNSGSLRTVWVTKDCPVCVESLVDSSV